MICPCSAEGGARLLSRQAGLAILLVAASPALAELEVSGAFRIRPGMVDGQVRPRTANSEAVVELRTILTGRVTTGPVEFLGQIRDSRAYGKPEDTALLAGDVNAFEPVQLRAAIDLADLAGDGTRLRLVMGRTGLDVGSRRLVSLGDYRNAAFFFTGVEATLITKGDGDVQLFWAMPQSRRPNDREAVLDNRPALDRESLAQQVFGLHAEFPVAGNIEVGATIVGLSERDRPDFPTRDRQLWTLGPRILKPPAAGQWDFEVEAFLQGGRASVLFDDPLAGPRPVRAGMVRTVLGYSWRGPLSPRLAVEFDHVSGDGPGERYGRFDQLFGARRFEFGPSSIYGVLGRANLTSPALRFTFDQPGRASGWVTARGLWSASATDSFSTSGAFDPLGEAGRLAGAQVDSRLFIWLVPRRLRADLNATGLVRRGVLEEAAPGRRSIYVASGLEAYF